MLRSKCGTRWRCRRCCSNIPAGLQEKHKKAIFAKNKGWYSGSSSSNGGEEKRLRDQEEEEELREQVELLRKQQRVEKGPETQGEPTRRGSGLEEYCKMEVEEEIDRKRKLDEQRKSLQKQLCEDRTSAAPEDAEVVSEVAEFAGQEETFSQRSLCL